MKCARSHRTQKLHFLRAVDCIARGDLEVVVRRFGRHHLRAESQVASTHRSQELRSRQGAVWSSNSVVPFSAALSSHRCPVFRFPGREFGTMKTTATTWPAILRRDARNEPLLDSIQQRDALPLFVRLEDLASANRVSLSYSGG